jgi:quercetin dioxygenase-like cupin family protein
MVPSIADRVTPGAIVPPVEIIDLRDSTGREVTAFGSRLLTAEHVLRGATTAVTVLRVRAGGEIGRHPAVGDQFFFVVAGHGETRSGDGPWHEISTGQAALWRSGEDHTTRAAEDLTALVVEAEDLLAGPPRD